MNGNTPYAGLPETVAAGQPTPEDQPELTADQRRVLRGDLSKVTRQVRRYLPDEYVVGAEVNQGSGGTQAMVAVRPPAGHPISAGFQPDPDAESDTGEYIPESDREELARGLAASAALQAKQATDDITPTAR